MPNRLANAVSPYLRSHADNPVDWWQWGAEPFAEAERRDVPVLVSIGYSTCHWCHVMARESFSDPALAAYLNENFVAIKVDREEYPDVDSAYMAAAGAFTSELGWPLSAFVTPGGRTFFAGTYWPPNPGHGRAAFRQVLEAVVDAWRERRGQVESTAATIASSLADHGAPAAGELPHDEAFRAVVAELVEYEDRQFGGFGGAPKFPVPTVIGFLLDRETAGDAAAGALARRTLDAMAASELRDPIEGGFFRYATRRDWSEPHYERMLYDNAQLLTAYTRIDRADIAEGIASFLLTVLRLPSGGFASAQDSESTVDGIRVEGGYYALDIEGRGRQVPPRLDDKVLTGWNGLAIEALAAAGSRLGHPEWIEAARAAANYLNSGELKRGELRRARIGEVLSAARPTLEDYGMLANGLIEVTLATGEVAYASRARELIAATMAAGDAAPFGVPGGGDPVLRRHGFALDIDPSDGAYPSGVSSVARAAIRLHLLSGDSSFLAAATGAMEPLAPLAVQRPMAFGAALGVMSARDAGARQLVVVTDQTDAAVASVARSARSGGVVSVVTPRQATELAGAGFELYAGRVMKDGLPTAYLCENFLCRLPITDSAELLTMLSNRAR